MNWFKRKPKEAIPNPRDRRRRVEYFDQVQTKVLLTTQFLVFSLAILILLVVSQ